MMKMKLPIDILVVDDDDVGVVFRLVSVDDSKEDEQTNSRSEEVEQRFFEPVSQD